MAVHQVHHIDAKDRAIKTLVWGLLLQILPTAVFGFLESNSFDLHVVLDVLLVLSFLAGFVFLFKGSFQYLKSRGYASGWGVLAIFSIFGISAILLPYLIQVHRSGSEAGEQPKANFFQSHNVTELLLLFGLTLPLLYVLLVSGLYALVSGSDIFQVIEGMFSDREAGMSTLGSITTILSFGHFFIFLIQSFRRSGIHFSRFWAGLKRINIRELGIISLLDFIFSMSLGTITLYGLSYLFPQSIENYLNESRITTVASLGIFAFAAIIMAPIVEELLFRGFILQKWSLKWGVKVGVFSSSLLFAICHLNFHIPALFIGGILMSSVYLQSKNLTAPILLHSFYNFLVMVWIAIDFFSKSVVERHEMISIIDYQSLIEPLLPQRFLLLALSTPAIIYYLYKRFPRHNTPLPELIAHE